MAAGALTVNPLGLVLVERAPRGVHGRGGHSGTASGDRVSHLGGAVRSAVRLGRLGPGRGRWLPYAQPRLLADHALSGGTMGAVRAVAVGGLAHLCPGLAFPAEGLTLMVSGPDVPVLASLVIRQALVPMAAFYLILMAALG